MAVHDVSRLALNHMVAPRLPMLDLFELATRLGVPAIEIRNDLQGVELLSGLAPAAIGAEASRRGLGILTINALQRFNQWDDGRAAEARVLAAAAQAVGAKALVLVPTNDVAWQPAPEAAAAELQAALQGLAPILAQHNVLGFVEPLGFVECSLRYKRQAVEAIAATGLGDRFRLVHDTFHHFVAGETEMFPAMTGLVHVSGVEDSSVSVAAMRDKHRSLITAADRIDNVGQIRALCAGGYDGPLSFEPFAESVHQAADIEKLLAASIHYLTETA